MKKSIMLVVLLGVMASGVSAEVGPSKINLRDADLEGMMRIDSKLTLTATFDVRSEDLFDELVFDFYMLLEPHDDDRGPQLFHCRTVLRFLEEGSGYTSVVTLPADVVKCINPKDSEYAVVVTYRGEEVEVENSLKKRWWESGECGTPIENVLTRSGSSYVRTWEAGK
jgi:hypothetical protein